MQFWYLRIGISRKFLRRIRTGNKNSPPNIFPVPQRFLQSPFQYHIYPVVLHRFQKASKSNGAMEGGKSFPVIIVIAPDHGFQ
jgi:hypothetical protein